MAQGGRQLDKFNTTQLPHAAGVIAIGGGTGPTTVALPAPTLMETGGVGIYARGAEQTIIFVPHTDGKGNILGPDVPSGPAAPGAGVLGRGGIGTSRGPVGAGVIGLAGGMTDPGISETDDVGVYGAGSTGLFGHGLIGVSGLSLGGPGVHGQSTSGRGGTFESEMSAQIGLLPRKAPLPFAPPVPVTPTAIPVGPEGAPQKYLPKDGQGGDLLALRDVQGRCTLWFCIQDPDGMGTKAMWAQVSLLGTPFRG